MLTTNVARSLFNVAPLLYYRGAHYCYVLLLSGSLYYGGADSVLRRVYLSRGTQFSIAAAITTLRFTSAAHSL